eukprot:7740972-Ditylum_brightwellii.AAC.1
MHMISYFLDNKEGAVVTTDKACLHHYLHAGRIVIHHPDASITKINFRIQCPSVYYMSMSVMKLGMSLFPTTGGDIENFDKFILDELQG